MDNSREIAQKFLQRGASELTREFRSSTSRRTGRVRFRGSIKNAFGEPDQLIWTTKRSAFVLNHGFTAGTRVNEKIGRKRSFTRRSSFTSARDFIGRTIRPLSEDLAAELGENFADIAARVPNLQ